jgi:hypothetical protein
MEVNKKHVVQLQGKDFITYDGLLDMAHQMGLVSIETELVDKDPYIFRAVAKTEGQTFTGYGDADNNNVNSMIAKHKIRMAETRAKARALRDLTNVGMCSVEEMGGESDYKPADAETAKEVFNPKLKDLPDGGYEAPKTNTISEAQQKRLFGLAGYAEDKDRAKGIVQELLDEYKLKSTAEIKKGKEYNEICEKAELLLADCLVPAE